MSEPVPVTAENFIRAESDLYMSVVALKENGFGQFEHHRELAPIDGQTVVRMNRDALYSAAVFDLDAGPVTVTLPDSGKRFMSMLSARATCRLRCARSPTRGTAPT